MIGNTRPDLEKLNIHKQILSLKLSIEQVNQLSKKILSLSTSFGSHRKQETYEKIELVQIEIKQKIKNLAFNIDQMVVLIDYKLCILTAYLQKIQKNGSLNKNITKFDTSQTTGSKNKVDQSYQIKQLEDRIYNHQLKQKDYVQQIQQLKQKNKKLMEQFSKLSHHSNKKIVELSQQIYNNTSPNLTIRGRNREVENPQISYIASQRNQPIYNRSRQNQPLIKTKYSPFQNEYKKPTANILSGLVSEQSSFDKDFELQQSSRQGLRFGCLPTKNNTQKTKTGSSSINKKQSLQDRSDKKRRFDFLLNNLNKQGSNSLGQQGKFYGSQCDSYRQQKSVFQSNVVKRYQI